LNQSISAIRAQPDRYAPIGLTLIAFIVYVAHLHFRGYPGGANLYYDAARDGNTDLPELVSYPPLLNWVPPLDARKMVDDAKANATPIYIIIREQRFDSPLMRTLAGTIETNFEVEYQSILTEFTLEKSVLWGIITLCISQTRTDQILVAHVDSCPQSTHTRQFHSALLG
jgi:hypothetical protein